MSAILAMVFATLVGQLPPATGRGDAMRVQFDPEAGGSIQRRPSVGPGRSCDPASLRDPYVALVCTDDGLAKAWLELNQVGYALRYQIGDEEYRRTMRPQSADSWKQLVAACPIDPNKTLSPPARQSAVACIKQRVSIDRDRFLGLLTGEAAEEARRRAEEHVALQQKLIDLGYLAGPADGNYGPATRAAVLRFRADYKLGPSGFMSDRTARQLANTSKTAAELLEETQRREAEIRDTPPPEDDQPHPPNVAAPAPPPAPPVTSYVPPAPAPRIVPAQVPTLSCYDFYRGYKLRDPDALVPIAMIVGPLLDAKWEPDVTEQSIVALASGKSPLMEQLVQECLSFPDETLNAIVATHLRSVQAKNAQKEQERLEQERERLAKEAVEREDRRRRMELTALEKADLASQLENCWSAVGGAKVRLPSKPQVRIKTDNNGDTIDAALINEADFVEPRQRSAAQSAVRAALDPGCRHLNILREKLEFYRRQIVVTFNADSAGQSSLIDR